MVSGVGIRGRFDEVKDLKDLHIIQSIVVDDVPLLFIDGTALPIPYVDTPPGGYLAQNFDLIAYSGEAEHPDRPIVNAPIGDRDRSGATLAGRSAVELALLSP